MDPAAIAAGSAAHRCTPAVNSCAETAAGERTDWKLILVGEIASSLSLSPDQPGVNTLHDMLLSESQPCTVSRPCVWKNGLVNVKECEIYLVSLYKLRYFIKLLRHKLLTTVEMAKSRYLKDKLYNVWVMVKR